MITCEVCGCPNFHFCEDLGIVCEGCIRTDNDCIAKELMREFYDGSPKMDLVNSDESFYYQEQAS